MTTACDRLYQRIIGNPERGKTRGELHSLRIDIAQMIQLALPAKRDSLGCWEKLNFSRAIAALHANTRSSTDFLLRSCVYEAALAGIPPEQRSAQCRYSSDQRRWLDEVTYETLCGDLKKCVAAIFG